MSYLELFGRQFSGRHLDLPVEAYRFSPPPGPHIEVLDDGFKVMSGEGLIDTDEYRRLEQTLGEQKGLPPVQLEAEPDALERWGEWLINDAFRSRTVDLVRSLGLYRPEDGFLATTEIVRRITNSLNTVLPVRDTEGQAVSVLDLFDGNREACIAALISGMYTLVIGNLEQNEKNPTFAKSVFQRAAEKLNVILDDYETSLQIMNQSAVLHDWLYPGEGVSSILQGIEHLLNNGNLRTELYPFLEQAGLAMLNAGTQQQMLDNQFLPAGQLTIIDKSIAPIDPAGLQERLETDSIAALQFILYLMNRKSHHHLIGYLRWRFGKEQFVSRPNLPIIEVDNGTQEEEDGNN